MSLVKSILISLLLGSSVLAENAYENKPFYASEPKYGTHGGVAADSTQCSQVGVKVLKKGGNAIDAAVASTICQGLIYPFASGIGGGGYMLVRTKDDDSYFINFREMAPKLATETMFINNTDASLFGGLAVGIPGEIKGLEVAHQKFGRLPWKVLFDPTIKLARDGYNVTKQLAARLVTNEKYIRSMPGLKATYVNSDGSLLKEGQIAKHTKLAKTLGIIAEQGSEGFYSGEVAESIAKTIKENGGILTTSDLKAYKVDVKPALKSTFLGNTIHFLPPPTSGAVSFHILKILESLNLPKDTKKLDYTVGQQFIEALKFGFAGRLQLGDPEFNDISKQLNYLLDPANAVKSSKRINITLTQEPKYYLQDLEKITMKEDHGTSHISALDSDGLSVSVTSTINTDFGSKVLDLNTGILLNNQMDDFSSPGAPNYFGLPPSKYNFVQPFKRPQSSMTPLVISDPKGGSLLIIGASGGSRIITSVVQSVFNHYVLGLPINTSVDSARIHHQLIPNNVRHEPQGLTKGFLDYLIARNHTLIAMPKPEAVVNSIKLDRSKKCKSKGYHTGSKRKVTAVSDIRKNGVADAY